MHFCGWHGADRFMSTLLQKLHVRTQLTGTHWGSLSSRSRMLLSSAQVPLESSFTRTLSTRWPYCCSSCSAKWRISSSSSSFITQWSTEKEMEQKMAYKITLDFRCVMCFVRCRSSYRNVSTIASCWWSDSDAVLVSLRDEWFDKYHIGFKLRCAKDF